ncbi:MAG: DNA repair protein RecN [Bacteroidales bacterium]|nr:DNA repair protein RecN [Bacteroidales bacterium]
MLKSLFVQNYALIDELEISFSEGFTAITGETGAGKSILLGALGLILGNRADLQVLKNESQKCIVEGTFDTASLNLDRFFHENDIEKEITLILRREILTSGKSRAFINDSPVNLQQMKELSTFLMDVHSQHETLQLVSAEFQMDVLDSFINRPELLAAYAKEYQSFAEVSKNLERLIRQATEKKREEDFLRFQFEELNEAKLSAEEFIEIEERLLFLNHTEEIKNSLAQSVSVLDEGNEPVLGNLIQIVKSFDRIGPFLSEAASYSQRFQSIVIELKDLIAGMQSKLSDTDFDPGELELLTQRMDQISKLMFKHHVQHVEQLIVLRDEIEARLVGIQSLDDEILQAEKKRSLLKLAVKAKANELHDEREAQAIKLAESVKQMLPSLGIKNGTFNIKVERQGEFNAKGNDLVTFWFSANLGVPPGEISRMASGGELSRLMLIIKSLITKEQMLPTVIFDEIDSGVSGDIAGKVGAIMKQMSQFHQVIAITHLPQIAAGASHQYKVFKTTDEVKSFTNMKLLLPDERVEEIAKMLSNEKVTLVAMQAASELLGF